MVKVVSLLRWYDVELPGTFLIKYRAFGLVAAAPMLVAPRDEEKFARPDTLFAGFIFVQVSALDADNGDVVRVAVYPRSVAGIELGKRSMGAFFRVTCKDVHGSAARRHGFIGGFG